MPQQELRMPTDRARIIAQPHKIAMSGPNVAGDARALHRTLLAAFFVCNATFLTKGERLLEAEILAKCRGGADKPAEASAFGGGLP
jgi:hypothetical protein